MHVEIPKNTELEEKVFSIDNEKQFSSIALGVYHFQFANNPLYREYCMAVHRTPETVLLIEDIPFLPISFFKTHEVRTTNFEAALLFRSSGTTGMATSAHFVKKPALYEKSFRLCFEQFYGTPAGYCILGLLPSYLERGQSSLVYMVDRLIHESGHPRSGFYLNDLERLAATLDELEGAGQKVLLIGVTYALLDFARRFPRILKNTIVMETGGMKGRQKEMTRPELYAELREGFGIEAVHSEYGMTELLSQAYAVNGIFRSPGWMKLLLRDETDPFALKIKGTGAVNVIDLANLYSCSFIATEDIGRIAADGSFEILGRMDHSDVRGCSLLAI
jgi:hypothetical protein